MLTLGDIKTETAKIAAKSGLTSRIPLWAHTVALDILSRYPFWFMVDNTTLTTVANQATYILSPRVDGRRLLKFNNETDNTHVDYQELAQVLWQDPTPVETGLPYSYSPQGMARVQGQPSSSSVLSCVSSSSSDNINLLIRGTSGGIEVYERVTLTGTSPVSSVNAYTSIESIQKSATSIGTITVTSNSGGVTNVSLAPQLLMIEAPQIRFQLVPDAARTLRYYFYKKVLPMADDYDISPLPEAFQWKCHMYGILEIAHLNNQDYEQANFYHNKMEAGIAEMMDWAAPHGRVVPKSKQILSGFKNYDYSQIDGYTP